MMKKSILSLAILLLGLNISVFAQDDTKIVVAKVNDETITLEELNKAVQEYNDHVKHGIYFQDKEGSIIELYDGGWGTYEPSPRIITPEQKTAFLKKVLIGTVLLYQEAIKRGLDNEEDIKIKLSNKSEVEKRTILVRELMKKEKVLVVDWYEEKFPTSLLVLQQRSKIADLISQLKHQAKIEIFADKIK